jgi:hypothetical protein
MQKRNLRWTESLVCLNCLANNLNPYKREIYPIPFWNSKLGKNDMQPVTAYTVCLQKAQASWKLDGWETDHYRS